MTTLLLGTARDVIVLPKNGGLVAQAAQTLDALGEIDAPICRVRGEDVAYVAAQFAEAGRNVLAITGDDLLDEWLACGNVLDPRLRRARVPWNDPAAVYGKPALCLIGPPEADLDKPLVRVAICSKYRCLSLQYIKTLRCSRSEIVPIEVQGALENLVLADLADFLIDIVVTGNTIRAAGMTVRDVIRTSDLAVLESQQELANA